MPDELILGGWFKEEDLNDQYDVREEPIYITDGNEDPFYNNPKLDGKVLLGMPLSDTCLWNTVDPGCEGSIFDLDTWRFRKHTHDYAYDEFHFPPEFDNLAFAEVITSNAVRNHICKKMKKYVRNVGIEDIRLYLLNCVPD